MKLRRSSPSFGALAVGVALAAGGWCSRPLAQGDEEVRGGREEGRGQGPRRPPAPAQQKAGGAQGPAAGRATRRSPNVRRRRKRDALADKKRDEAIERLQAHHPQARGRHPAEGGPALPALRALLGEVQVPLPQGDGRSTWRRQKEYDAAREPRREGARRPRRTTARASCYRAETMRLYETILRELPDVRAQGRGALLPRLQPLRARQEGRGGQALRGAHPRATPSRSSSPDAYVQLGNHYFDDNKLAKAKDELREGARHRACPKIYAYAALQAGLVRLQRRRVRGRPEEAAGGGRLRRAAAARSWATSRTRRSTTSSVFFVQLNRPDEAIAYFKAKAPARSGRRASSPRLAVRARRRRPPRQRHQDVPRASSTTSPMGAGAPEYQQAIVRAYEGLRQRDQVSAEMKKLVELYRPGSTWWQANEANKAGAAQRLQRHRRGDAHDGDRVPPGGAEDEAGGDLPARARHLQAVRGRVRLQRGPRTSSPTSPSTCASSTRKSSGRWRSGRPPPPQYDDVVAFKIPERDSAQEVSQREVPQERRLQRDPRLRQAGEDRARPAHPEDRAQGRPEGRREQEEGRRSRSSRRSSRSAREGARRRSRSPSSRSKLVAACDTLQQALPGQPGRDRRRATRPPSSSTTANHFVDAAQRFGDIIDEVPRGAALAGRRRPHRCTSSKRSEEWLELNKLVAPVPRPTRS